MLDDGCIIGVTPITFARVVACRVMTNGDPEGQTFLSYPHKYNGFFFLLTTVFIYQIINLLIYLF